MKDQTQEEFEAMMSSVGIDYQAVRDRVKAITPPEYHDGIDINGSDINIAVSVAAEIALEVTRQFFASVRASAQIVTD